MKKRLGLVGCGNLGFSLANYIGKLGFDELFVHDLDQEKSLNLKENISKVYPMMHVEQGIYTNKVDVILLSLSGPQTIEFVTDPKNHSCFSGDKVFVSLGRPSYDDIAQHEELDRYLVENNITLLFGLGLEPGLVEILMQYVAWQQGSKSLTCLRSVCGGVPLNPTPPLNYDLLFGDRLPSLNRRALFKLNGSLSYCNRFDICERSFVDGVGMLEVFHDGLSPYLLSSPYIKDIPNIKQQTARWPGFFECMRTLIALGLLEDAPTLAGDLVPNDLTHSILMQNGNLKRNGPDISFVEVTGELASGGEVKVSLVSTWDEESNLTGMAKLTSFMVTWAAWEMTGSHRDCRAGLILGHQYFHGEKTSELLESFKEHIGCTVKLSFTDQ